MADNKPFLVPLTRAGFRVSWVDRIPEVAVDVERDEAIARLMPHHTAAALQLCKTPDYFWRCEQTHSNKTVSVSGVYNENLVKDADGLTTNDPKVVLGIHIADCGAIYIGDPKAKAVAVVHSGKVGTEKNILGASIQVMQDEFGSAPSDLIVSLAPCIRPPAYEVDFAATIREQAMSAGVLTENYTDCGICTTSDPEAYYSYRVAEGKTGRMLALIAL